MADHGATREQIAMVAVKNHAHSVHNPYAHYQREISLEEVMAARLVADPLGGQVARYYSPLVTPFS